MNLKTVCYGEVLWDIFPDGKRIGGAPLNVAFRLSANEIETTVISKIGEDKKGEEILKYLHQNDIGTDLIQTDTSYPTGIVNVTLNNSGSATYEITHPSAWDKIEIKEEMVKAVENADAFIFGSLICRDEISRNTLYQLIKAASYKVFDINLRPPHYEKGVLQHLMQQANFIKFNDEELYEVAKLLGSPFHSLDQNLTYISEKTDTSSICVTKGSHGAVLLKEGKLYYNSGYQIKVKDTVGAGDSFLASLISSLLREEHPQKAIDHACAVGALVAGSEGANPVLKEEEIRMFMFPDL